MYNYFLVFMTMYTSLGAHHGRVRKISFNPRVRGSQYAKGKGTRVYEDRTGNVISKERCKRECVSIEVDELNSKPITEKTLENLSHEASRALSIIGSSKIRTTYRWLEKLLGKEKARKARNELEKHALVNFDEIITLNRNRTEPIVVCYVDEGVQPELEMFF